MNVSKVSKTASVIDSFPDCVIKGYKIVIITPGFITVNTSARYMESIYFEITFWKKILLNFFSQIKRLLHFFPFNQAFGHFIDCITGIPDFIIGKNLHVFVKVTVSDPSKRHNNVPERDAQVAAHQNRQRNPDPDKNHDIDAILLATSIWFLR